MLVPSLVALCVLALRPHAAELQHIQWAPLPFSAQDTELDVHTWIVLIHLFSHLPPRLCAFTTAEPLQYTHGFLSVLSLPHATHLTPDLLRATPNLAALDASSTALASLPPSLVHLRVLYLRNCPRVTDSILPVLCALPRLSVVDLSGTKCSPVDPRSPFAPSTLSALFQPSIQDALAALAALYSHACPFPLYTLTYLPPPPPPPVPRRAIQDSFVVFSSSSTKMGNTNTLLYEEEHPDFRPKRHSLPRPTFYDSLPRPAFYASRPRPPLPTASPLHLHRPPPLSSPIVPPPKPRSTPATSASLNLHNHKALLAHKGIDAVIKLRSTPSTPCPDRTPSSNVPSTSRNPFKKPALKPISSFPPPLLPPSLIPRDLPPRKKPKLPAESPKLRSFDLKSWASAPSKKPA